METIIRSPWEQTEEEREGVIEDPCPPTDCYLCDDVDKTVIECEADDKRLEARIDNLVEKWSWVIGGVVSNNPEYVKAIIHDYLGLPLPESTEEYEQWRNR